MPFPLYFLYFLPLLFSFRYTSASLLLLSNKAQVTAGSFYYEMVHLFLFTTSLSIYHFRFGWVKSRPIFLETLFYPPRVTWSFENLRFLYSRTSYCANRFYFVLHQLAHGGSRRRSHGFLGGLPLNLSWRLEYHGRG